MRIYCDNIIFNLQKIGGISIYFAELIKRFLGSELDVRFIERSDTHPNIARQALLIQDERIVRERNLALVIARYIPIRLNLHEKAIVHSSYYRTCYDRRAVNIVTAYDFTYEYFRKGPARYVHSFTKCLGITHAAAILCMSNQTHN